MISHTNKVLEVTLESNNVGLPHLTLQAAKKFGGQVRNNTQSAED